MSRQKPHGRNAVSTLMLSLVAIACVSAAGLFLGRLLAERTESAPAMADRSPRRDFALMDTTGTAVSLETYRGKWLLLFFGFTSCPEACPMALMNAGETLRELGEDAPLVQPAFVSVDPDRDTREVIKDYISNFDPRIAGLSGTPEAVSAMAKAYGVFYRKRALEGGDYTIDHSTAFYLVSPTGEFQRAFTSDSDPADFAAELKSAMVQTKGIVQ
jgi:protein SCO1/2